MQLPYFVENTLVFIDGDTAEELLDKLAKVIDGDTLALSKGIVTEEGALILE